MCPKKLDTFNSTEKKPGSWKHYAEFYRHANYRRENFQTYFDQVAGSADKYRAIFEDNYCPVFVVDCVAEGKWPHTYVPKLILNPCLRDLEFVRVVEPYTAYQQTR